MYSYFLEVILCHDVLYKLLFFLIYISDMSRDENGTDIFRPYSKPNPFRGVEICPYPSLDIQHPIPYPYPNTQIAYL